MSAMIDVFINLPILGMWYALIFVTYFFIFKKVFEGKDDKCPRIEALFIPHLPLSEKTNLFSSLVSTPGSHGKSVCGILDLNIKPRSPLNQRKKEISV